MNSAYFMTAANMTTNGLRGGNWVKRSLGKSVEQARTAVKPNSSTVMPEAENNITGRVPAGSAVTPVNVVKGLPPFEQVTIVIDARAVNNGQGAGKTNVVLFDTYFGYRTENGLPREVVGGPDVYVGSVDKNHYDGILARICSRSYYFYGMTVKVDAAPSTNQNTPSMQLAETISIYRTGVDEGKYKKLHMLQYGDPYQQDDSRLAIQTLGEYALVDGETAWVYPSLDGIRSALTLWLALETR